MSNDERTVIVDPERTILMPTPGGQATAAVQQPAVQQAPRPTRGVELQRLVAGINPLVGAASVLLALVAQLRATTAHSDPAGLRQQLLEHVAEFEAVARAHGVPVHQVSAARYVLCSFIDEVIAATPWGAGGAWAERNLLQEFHDERWGGEKAFKLLERLSEDPVTNHDLLELFYVCLALGFEGRYRGVVGGRAQLDAVAERVLDLVKPVKDAQTARTLSLRWQAIATRGRRRVSLLPPWVVLALGAAAVLTVFLALNARLDRIARPLFREIHASVTALRVDRTALAAKPRLAPQLQADIAAGAIEVRDEATRSVLTLPADPLFAAGTARLDASRLDLLRRVAQALKPLPGVVVVVGHTDGTAVASLQFPSNWHLSRERALAVAAALVQQGLQADRVRAEGRADAEPRAADNTPAGHAKNRRVEIELLLPRPDA